MGLGRQGIRSLCRGVAWADAMSFQCVLIRGSSMACTLLPTYRYPSIVRCHPRPLTHKPAHQLEVCFGTLSEWEQFLASISPKDHK